MKDTTGCTSKDGGQKVRRKPGRVPTSCMECRRLKLKCDRNVPCGTCVSRKCSAICPDGSLQKGKSNRLFLANTEELHDRIEDLSTRNRVLEDALRALQASVSQQTHPLLEAGPSQSTSLIHSSVTPFSDRIPGTASTLSTTGTAGPSPVLPQRLDSALQDMVEQEVRRADAFGTLAMGFRGENSFFGRTARPDFLIRAAVPRNPSRPLKRVVQPYQSEIGPLEEANLRQEIRTKWPSLSEVQKLCRVYQEHGKYLYTPLPQVELDEILEPICRGSSHETLSFWHSRGLSFIIFALGAFFDKHRPPYSTDAEEYYRISRKALDIGVPPSRQSIQALVHTAQYLDFSDSDSTRADAIWMSVTHTVRSGQMIGIHLNGARWNLPEKDVQCRRHLFWQLFHLDTWEGFYFGRPPIMSATDTDFPTPDDDDLKTVSDAGETSLCFHRWNWKFAGLLRSIIDTAFGLKPISYGTVLCLDSQVRDHPVPDKWVVFSENAEPLDSNTGQNQSTRPSELYIQGWLVLCSKEITLLNLHRPYFTRALQDLPDDLPRHTYVASVVAIYRSAWRIIEAIHIMWERNPRLLSRMGLPWSHALSAGIVMCLLVTRSPTSSLSPSALTELGVLVKMFQEAKPDCKPAASLLDPILNLHRKARGVMAHGPTFLSVLSDAELDRLCGKTHLLVERDVSDSTGLPRHNVDVHSSLPTSEPEHAYPSSERSVESDKNLVHPSLAEHVQSFMQGGRPALGSQSLLLFDAAVASTSTFQQMHHDSLSEGGSGLDRYHRPPESQSPIQSRVDAGVYAGVWGGSGYSIYGQPPRPYLMSAVEPPPIDHLSWQCLVEQLGFGVNC